MPGTYELKLVSRAGVARATLNDAQLTSVRRELNGVDTATFVMHPLDPQHVELDDFKMVARELQVWRDGSLYFQGPVISAVGDDQVVTFTAKGLLWYFAHRYFGPSMLQYVYNGSFEESLNGWETVGCFSSVNSSPEYYRGNYALLQATANDADQYLSQAVSITTGAVPRPSTEGDESGLLVRLAGWCKVNPAAGLWAGAYGERGLFVERRTPGGDLIKRDWAPITADTPKGELIRLSTHVIVPANTTETLEVRLYAMPSGIAWDKISLTAPESVGSAAGGSPVTDIMRSIVIDAAQLHASKSDLGIGFSGSGGKTIVRDYQYADNGNILQALAEFADAGLADFEVSIPSAGGAATFVAYVGGKGSFKPHLNVHDANLTSFRKTFDGEQASTWHRVLGRGEGTDRELSHIRTFSTAEIGSTVLESVSTAPPETTIGGLDDLAKAEADRRRPPVVIAECSVRSDAHVTDLKVGDTIPIAIFHGWSTINANYRVVWTELDPRNDELKIGLNAVPPS